jgi:hypothetical protein
VDNITKTRLSLYRWGVLLHTASSLYAVFTSLPTLMQGPDAQTITEGVPQFVIVVSALLGMAGLVSAYGAWQEQKWGIALTIALEAVNGLLALPGVLFAPTEFARISAIAGVLVAVFVIYAMLRLPRTVRLSEGEQ